MNNRLRNGLIIALVISIALNLLLVGIGIGQTFHEGPPMMRMNPMMGLTHFAHDLSAQRRKELAETLRAFREASRPAIGEMRELQQELRAEIRRDPVDPVRLKLALEALQNHMQASQTTSAEAFVQLMQALTPEERLALDRSMRRPMRQGPPPFNGPHHGHGPSGVDNPAAADPADLPPPDAPLPDAPLEG
jgi:uncharacterized membrane protein